MRSKDDVGEPKPLHRDPRRELSDPPPDARVEPIESPAPRPPAVESEPKRPTVTSSDPRLRAVEPAVSAGDWKQVADVLGPNENAGNLPPTLGLVYALARKEIEHDEAANTRDPGTNQLAIRCMAGLFGVEPDSPIALVLAKRLLRKNPVGWRQRPAPSAKVSILFVALAIVIGSAIGWVASGGYVHLRFR